jgi:hypothetical protein
LKGITDIRGGGGRSPAEQARIDAFFDSMTPAELAEFQQKNADVINMIFGPKLLMMAYDAITGLNKPTMVEGSYTPPAQIVNAMGGMGGYNPSLFSPTVTPVVTVGELSPTTAPSSAPSGGGGGVGISGGGAGGGSMGGGGGGGNTGAVSSAVSGGTLGGSMGISTSSLGGIGSGGGDGGGAGSGGGGGGGSGGCCFIMLEARYGDGTMDAVVRRYRDEKITDRNKRGYYKLAEVFVPLMRESRLFKFMVAKTFADPLVSYGKWHYGQNRHGWIFKPVERFWMKIFNVLGNDTKFIRENGETV